MTLNGRTVVVSLVVVVVLASLYALFISAPRNTPQPLFAVTAGGTVTSVAYELRDAGAIRSPLVFRLLARLFGSRGVIAGTYALNKGETIFSVSRRFATGDTDLKSVRVTFPEGSSTREMALILEKSLVIFNREDFLRLSKGGEGYLFPDTYFIIPGTRPEEIIELLNNNFAEKIAPYLDEVTASGKTLDEIIIMASLIEKEARQSDTRRTVAGILWKRIDRDMPLQVDAVFGYIFERDTYSPSFEDLETDSPYNTYKHRGLPPGPISNPGIDAIEAALRPTQSPYLYYLTGKDGNMYYARTFEEHVANRSKLR